MSFWDKVSGIYDLTHVLNRRVENMVCTAVEREVPKNAKVLDCAGGTGLLSAAAAKKARHVLCADLSGNMLIQAMKRARKNGIFNISFAKRDILALKDGDGKYDAVIAGNIIHLLDDPEKAFSELVRVTKKGGKIIIPTYLQGERGFVFQFFIRIYKLLGFDYRNAFTADSYMKFIAENAEKNGCREYRTEIMAGHLPSGFSVITK